VPGRFADLVVLDDLERVAIAATMIDGRWAYDDGVYDGGRQTFAYPAWSKSTMRVGRTLTPDDMSVSISGNAHLARVRAIAVTSPKEQEEFVLKVEGGVVQPDAGQGVSSIVVVDRHKASGRVGKGFVSRLFVQRGAIASTVSHDAHNLMVIGADHEDMAIAANRSIDNGGGYAVVLDGEVIFEMKLPVAGLMSEEPLDVVAARTRELVEVIFERLGAPRMPKVLLRMNGLSLPNIPNYGFTDHGMIGTQGLVTLEPVMAQGDESAIHSGHAHAH